MLYTLPILKPLFMAVARLPLVGPHGDQEAELLRSGAKPVAMFADFLPDVAELQKDVDEGRLVRCDVKRTLPLSSILYGWPGTDMDGIGETYKTLISSTDSDSKNFKDNLAHWHDYKNDLKLAEYDKKSTPASSLKKYSFKPVTCWPIYCPIQSRVCWASSMHSMYVLNNRTQRNSLMAHAAPSWHAALTTNYYSCRKIWQNSLMKKSKTA